MNNMLFRNPITDELLRLAFGSPTAQSEYLGEVVESGEKGFVFIGRHSVQDDRGNVIDVGPKDVYLSVEDFLGKGTPEVGTRLKFQLVPDERRGQGCLRAVQAHTENLALVPPRRVPVFPISVRTGEPSLYWAATKRVPQDLIERAEKNRPFDGMPRPTSEEQAMALANQENLAKMVSFWLMVRFAMFRPFNVNFDITVEMENDGADEARRISEYVSGLGEDAMVGAAENLQRQYQCFCNVRGIFRYLHDQGLVLPHSIIDVKYLPHTLMAAPVWFVRASRMDNRTEEHDPRPDHFVQHVCRLGKSQRFADLFQIFNRRSRNFKMYNGDIIQPHIYDIIKMCGSNSSMPLFDYLVIATPYLHLATREWADPKWPSLIDPYLLGFSVDLPEFYFMLGRWSDTGLQTGVEKMVGDTLECLEANAPNMRNFGDNPYWAFVEDLANGSLSLTNAGTKLPQFVSELIKASKAGQLFEWLADDGYVIKEEILG